MRLIALPALVLLLLIAGCSQPGPQESDVIGKWEATGMIPYLLLDYRGTNDGYLVARGSEDGSTEFLIIHLSNFSAGDDDFTLTATYLQNGSVQTKEIAGEIHGAQMALYLDNIAGPADYPTWFTRAEIFDASRDAARAALDTYRISTN
jgi:hypothetical protein